MKAMNKDKTKALAQKKTIGKTLFTFILFGITVAVIIAMEMYSTLKQGNTVDVLTFNCDVQKDTLITESMFEKSSMLMSEYEKSGTIEIGGQKRRQIVLWDDRQRLLDTQVYSQYYMHSNTPVYWYSVNTQKTLKNSYLYSMEGELLKLDISADEFGDFIVPGDKINVRTIYTEQKYYLPSYSEYSTSVSQGELGMSNSALATSETKIEEVLNNAVILDMLNGEGSSIYDIWYKWLAQPTDVQEAALSDETFKSLTKPSTILMCLPAEEVERFMLSKEKGGSYTITLLPRESSNVILNALDALNYSY